MFVVEITNEQPTIFSSDQLCISIDAARHPIRRIERRGARGARQGGRSRLENCRRCAAGRQPSQADCFRARVGGQSKGKRLFEFSRSRPVRSWSATSPIPPAAPPTILIKAPRTWRSWCAAPLKKWRNSHATCGDRRPKTLCGRHRTSPDASLPWYSAWRPSRDFMLFRVLKAGPSSGSESCYRSAEGFGQGHGFGQEPRHLHGL